MLLLFVPLLLVLAMAELALLIAVGDAIGIAPTLLLILAFSGAGIVLAKAQGLAVWRRFRATLARGQVPSAEMADGVLVLVGAVLLVTPGFISDLLGLMLLLPVSRAPVRRMLARRARRARRAGRLLFHQLPALSRLETTGRRRPIRKAGAAVSPVEQDEGRSSPSG